MAKQQVCFRSDGGHGWLEVPVKDVRASGADISFFSYLDEGNGLAYLEEDCDAGAFIQAIGGEEAFHDRYTVYGAYDGDRSSIRDLPSYR